MCDYENPWLYEGTPFLSEDIGDSFGFVYRITNLKNGRKYIGRKYFWSKRKPRITTKNKSRRRVTSESDWKKYYGSSPELKDDVKKYRRGSFSREILSIHGSLGKVNFEETRQLFLNEVLSQKLTEEVPLYYNSNILGRYYRKDYFNK